MRRVYLAAVRKVQPRIVRIFARNSLSLVRTRFAYDSYVHLNNTQKRFQSSASEKKFHCSICHKGFRLEMAARVHLQQAHGGDGSIEEGSGPGPEATVTATATASGLAASESVAETKTASPIAQGAQVERRPHRRERLTPTPLNTPDRVLPEHAMQQLLEMWDTIGTKRLGSAFIHSSMILKVFAAKPGDVAETRSGPLSSSGSRPAAPATAATASGASPPEHIPAYGSTQAVPSPLGGSVVSPFAQEVAQSPFVGSVISPFSEATAPPSPFVSDPPMSGSPFAPLEASSPFTMNGQTAAAPSPFLPEGATDASLPTYDYVPSAPNGVPTGGFMPTAEEVPRRNNFSCETCEREFSSYLGLRMHNKDKHGIKLPFQSEEGSDRSTRHATSSSLPAFIPSPVDLSHTSPFGMKKLMSAWTDTEIAPYAHAVNNIVIIGTVREIQKVDENTSQLVVLVRGDTAEEDETLTLRCFGECHSYAQKNLACDHVVLSSGSLRLLPVYDAKLNKYHTDAVVFVSLPQGILTKM